MLYFVNTPWIIKKLFSTYTWSVDTNEKNIYLTFDDGPHPVATPFVLDELKKYNAKASFFCIGKNVVAYPEIYLRIKQEGHAVGNHSFNHLNGWKTGNKEYLEDVSLAAKQIDSNLYRPPYGRIRASQAKGIPIAISKENASIIMWSVLGGDFDPGITAEKCLGRCQRAGKGDIITLHDSEKAYPKLSFVLPRLLEHYNAKGYAFKKLE